MLNKKIIIQCPCYFTRRGIEATLQDIHLVVEHEVIASLDRLSQCIKLLNSGPAPDVLIMTLSSMVSNPSATLHLLGEYYLVNPRVKTILINDMVSFGVMGRYICEFKNVLAILDISSSVETLEFQLLNTFQPFTCRSPQRYSTTPSLSPREMTVLQRLLDEQKTVDIAYDMRISPKTVSSHKRSALCKLGIRSLQPLMIKDYNRKATVNGSLSNIIDK
ncbi:DNA-binding response regulator [Serratia sp. 3ACOL1]|jgi:DNA-binding NarL/FixJ family response regulator|uniref:helix-turn-helix transcriptional regulator n=1 Tax=Serratia sp. 3ACOL1 TaxID=2448483 RepID=UPI000EF480F5|nr:LuxR C-terminal-related transcriptional regulator [Serratia sp. 3ACOL1]AYM93522.1 DNA-binding response regulator [Serratia sp. 3ACOL1]